MKDYKGFEGLYAITSCGKVWSYRKQKFLSPAKNGQGYWMVILWDNNGKKYTKKVHKLVAETYLVNDDPENKKDVGHLDNIKEHCWVNNLQYMTHAENIKMSIADRKKPEITPIRCVETGEIYNNQTQAAAAVGINRQCIVNVLAGKQNTAGGFHWERVYEDLEKYDKALAADLLLLELEQNIT